MKCVRSEELILKLSFEKNTSIKLRVLARDWYRCSQFIELLGINQHELDPAWQPKRKYCQLRAAYTVACIADQVMPAPGNPLETDQ